MVRKIRYEANVELKKGPLSARIDKKKNVRDNDKGYYSTFSIVVPTILIMKNFEKCVLKFEALYFSTSQVFLRWKLNKRAIYLRLFSFY